MYDLQALPAGVLESTVLSKIYLVLGDALTMQMYPSDESLCQSDEYGSSHRFRSHRHSHARLRDFDLIIFCVSLLPGCIPLPVQEALAEGGILVCPQCAAPPVGETKQKAGDSTGALYCVGQWRVYQKKEG